MSRILRVLKLKTSIDFSHLLDLEAPGGPASNDAKGPGGSPSKEPKIVWKLKTSINTSHLLGFGNGRLWEAKSIVFYVSGRLQEAQSVVFYVSGSSKRR